MVKYVTVMLIASLKYACIYLCDGLASHPGGELISSLKYASMYLCDRLSSHSGGVNIIIALAGWVNRLEYRLHLYTYLSIN